MNNISNAASNIWRPAPRPAWVAAINDLGRDLKKSGVQPVSLNMDDLLKQAEVRSGGLTDFGDEDFREGLAVLCKALDEEAELTLMGRIIVRDEIVNALQVRLWLEEQYRRYPSIEDERIKAPILIAGSARSGTTIVQELLAENPALRALYSWEVRSPWAWEAENKAELQQQADHELKIWHRVTPEIRAIHPWGGHAVQECSFVLAHSFRCAIWSFFQSTPSYGAWLGQSDLSAAYRYHHRFLKALQRFQPGKRWVLKMPGFVAPGQLGLLLKEYPDCRFIHTLRDPLNVIASLLGFGGVLQWQRSDRIFDGHIFSDFASKDFVTQFEFVKRMHREGRIHRDNFYDLLYHELVKDPIAALADVYQRFGMQLTDGTRSRMQTFLDRRQESAERPGAYQYSFEHTGLDLKTERRRHKAYQDHYGIKSEI